MVSYTSFFKLPTNNFIRVMSKLLAMIRKERERAGGRKKDRKRERDNLPFLGYRVKSGIKRMTAIREREREKGRGRKKERKKKIKEIRQRERKGNYIFILGHWDT